MIPQQPIHLACIDLGSNSFHCQVFAYHGPGKLYSVAIIKAPVALRDGMDEAGHLSTQAIGVAVDALAQFADVLAKHHVTYVRAIGTYTLRSISNQAALLSAVQAVFPYPIDIVSGETEAKLVFLGATAQALPDQQHLFIDIGGGSTEFIVGDQHGIAFLHSADIGSAAAQTQYFANGLLSAETMQAALVRAKTLLAPVVARLPSFVDVISSGGTVRCLFSMLQAQGVNHEWLQYDYLHQLKAQIIAKGHVSALQLPGLRQDRERVLAGGFCILLALLELLEVDTIRLAGGGVREGMLAELIQQIGGE